MADFKIDDRVEHVGKRYFGHIKAVDPETKEALVKNENTGQNNLVGLSWLVKRPKLAAEPFKPGWYSQGSVNLLNLRNHYYYCYQLGEGTAAKIMFTNSYNPVTGEMDATWVGGLLFPRELTGTRPADLRRLKMVPE